MLTGVLNLICDLEADRMVKLLAPVSVYVLSSKLRL